MGALATQPVRVRRNLCNGVISYLFRWPKYDRTILQFSAPCIETMKKKRNEMKNDQCSRNSQVCLTDNLNFLSLRVHFLLLLLNVIIDTSNVCSTAFTLNSKNKFVKLNGQTSAGFAINGKGSFLSSRRRQSVTTRMSTLMDPISSSSQSKFPHRRRQSKPSSFAQRMRSIIQKDNSHTNPSLPTSDILSTHSAKVKVAHTLEEFKAFLHENKDKIVVVRWFAPWCRVSEFSQGYYFTVT